MSPELRVTSHFGGSATGTGLYSKERVKYAATLLLPFHGENALKPDATMTETLNIETQIGQLRNSRYSSSDGYSPVLGEDREAAEARVGPAFQLPVSYRGIAGFLASLDFIIILSTALISGLIYTDLVLTDAPWEEVYRGMSAAIFIAILFVSTTLIRGLYEPTRLASGTEQFRYVVGAWCGSFLLLASGVFAWGVGKELSRGTTVLFCLIGGSALLAHRAFWRYYLPVALTSGAVKGRKAIVVSWDVPVSSAFLSSMQRHGYRVTARLVVGGDRDRTLEGLQSLIRFARGTAIDDIFLVPNGRNQSGLEDIVDILRILPFPVTLVPDESTARILRSPFYELGPHMAVEIQRPPLSAEEQILKRGFDLLLASIALLVLMPLLALISVAILLDSNGPVIFRQTRHGFNGRPFKIYKFRTMNVMEDGSAVGQVQRGDKRITRLGALLRRSSIDELPQLLNVLRGEMSIVGPRPHAVAHDLYFEKCVENYAFRHHVKSGITGWAQVHGSRGETETVAKIQQRVDLDLWYIRNWSFFP